MKGITPLIQTTFSIPSKQGKDIYSPIQKAIVKNKLAGAITSDKIELSTYDNKAAENVLDVLTNLKAKFIMLSKETD